MTDASEINSNASDAASANVSNRTSYLKVYEAGELTVVGFGDDAIPDELNVAVYRDQLVELIRMHNCKELAFDLTGVVLVPSGLLGLMASIRDQGVQVTIYNPSPDVREVLEITKLEELIHIRELDVP